MTLIHFTHTLATSSIIPITLQAVTDIALLEYLHISVKAYFYPPLLDDIIYFISLLPLSCYYI